MKTDKKIYSEVNKWNEESKIREEIRIVSVMENECAQSLIACWSLQQLEREMMQQ